MLFAERKRIVDLAAKHRLPSIYNAKEFVELGGLTGYGASIAALMRRAAAYVDKILKGAKARDLPVEQPTKFELAYQPQDSEGGRADDPQTLLLQADPVIE